MLIIQLCEVNFSTSLLLKWRAFDFIHETRKTIMLCSRNTIPTVQIPLKYGGIAAETANYSKRAWNNDRKHKVTITS